MGTPLYDLEPNISQELVGTDLVVKYYTKLNGVEIFHSRTYQQGVHHLAFEGNESYHGHGAFSNILDNYFKTVWPGPDWTLVDVEDLDKDGFLTRDAQRRISKIKEKRRADLRKAKRKLDK